MGVKKSTVWTSAWSGAIRYTPASSASSKPTRTFGSCCRANFPSTVSSAAGLSLDAQPAALTDSVSRSGLFSDMDVIVAKEWFWECLPEGNVIQSGGTDSKDPYRTTDR